LDLKKITFPPIGFLRKIDGFDGCCIGLIEIPASVKRIWGFGDSSFPELIVLRETKIKRIQGRCICLSLLYRPLQVFVVYDKT
jgi:hypothetical protein